MNIAVIFGGESCEHDISIITGEQLIDKCSEYLYNIIPIYIDKHGNWFTSEKLLDIDVFKSDLKGIINCAFVPNDKHIYIKKGKKYKKDRQIDMAFLCLHGLRGEDGCVASIMELSKIPYSSSSICSSSVCMDKCVFKNFAKGFGIKQVDYFCLTENEFFLDFESVKSKVLDLKYPIIIKPSRQGSSIGIEVCKNENELYDKLKKSFIYDKKILIEKFINIKKEVNVAILYDKGELIVSNTEEPISNDIILSFDNKYRKNPSGFEGIKRISPAKITKRQHEEIVNTAKSVYNELEMFGIVRFDFIISNDNEIYLNEVNTIPGSMANYLFDKEEYSYSKLIELLISNAIKRFKESDSVSKIFDSDVLTNDFDGFKK